MTGCRSSERYRKHLPTRFQPSQSPLPSQHAHFHRGNSPLLPTTKTPPSGWMAFPALFTNIFLFLELCFSIEFKTHASNSFFPLQSTNIVMMDKPKKPRNNPQFRKRLKSVAQQQFNCISFLSTSTFFKY